MLFPTGQIASTVVVLSLILLALYLFIREPIPIDISAIFLMVLTILLEPWTKVGIVKGFSGFADSAVLTILAMFILTEGVRKSGLLQKITSYLFAFGGKSVKKNLGIISGFTSTVSGIINNTPVVAMMIPILNNLSDKLDVSPSQLMMPLSYSAIAGGLLTLIGSSSNLIASSVFDRMVGRSFGMFEFTKLGAIVVVVTFIYMLTVGNKLLKKEKEHVFSRKEIAKYSTEIIVDEGSNYIGKSVTDFLKDMEMDVDIISLHREGNKFTQPFRNIILRKGDVMVVRAEEKKLVELLEDTGIDLVPEKGREHIALEEGSGYSLVNLIVLPGSKLAGETIVSSNFRDVYDISVLAIRKKGEQFNKRLNDIIMQPGDALLVQTTDDTIEQLVNNSDVAIARGTEKQSYNQRDARWSATIILGVVTLAAFDILPIVVSAFAGIVAMTFTGCISPHRAYKSVNWQVIFLLAGIIPLGIAMEHSGTAELLAGMLTRAGSIMPPVAILAAVFIITNLLSNIVNDNAMVVLMAPVSINIARNLGANPFSFVLAVAFAGGTAFMSPVGYQTNLMVYEPGKYSFKDYLKVGAPLQLILTPVIIAGIVYFWGV